MDRKDIILPSARKTQKTELLFFESDAMKKILKIIDKVALSDISILIRGESGVGKKTLVSYIHQKSIQKDHPLISINCASIKEDLLENELFGVKTDLSGKSILEQADQGILFLNEITELSLHAQQLLFNFLESSYLKKEDGSKISLKVRLIASTSKNLEEEVANKRFREDLFYKISSINLEIPSLRKRKEEISKMAHYFLTQEIPESSGMQCFIEDLSDEALQLLLSYQWPGNIRELKNVCRKLCVFVEGNKVEIDDIPQYIRSPQSRSILGEYDPDLSIHELNKQYILKSLSHFQGNKTKAAQALGITIKTLYNKLHEYDEFKKYSIQNKQD